jgi:hypothetical protein
LLQEGVGFDAAVGICQDGTEWTKGRSGGRDGDEDVYVSFVDEITVV